MVPLPRFMSPFLCAAFVAALAACGGGGGGGAGGSAATGAAAGAEGVSAATVIAAGVPSGRLSPIQEPECIADTSGRWVSTLSQGAGGPAEPSGKFFMAVRYAAAIDTPVTSSFGSLGTLTLTNFDPEAGLAAPDYGRWQRGFSDGDASTTSGFQMKCDEVGSFISTSTFARQKIIGAGPHAAYFYDFRDAADLTFARLPRIYDNDPATELVFQAEVEVPLMIRSGPADNPITGSLAVAQLSLGAYLRDSVSGKMFAYVFNLYQNRPSERPQIAQDEEVAYVSTPWQTNEYVSMPPASAGYASETWTGLRLFRIHVPQPKFAHALSGLHVFCAASQNRTTNVCQPGLGGANFSLDPANYRLVSFGMLHEVFTGAANQISSGVHYRAVGAYQTR